jgi:pimeloyl-ACP methyl ester carboxylesterase
MMKPGIGLPIASSPGRAKGGCGAAHLRLHLDAYRWARAEPVAGQPIADSIIDPGGAETKRMRVVRCSAVIVIVVAATSASAQNPARVESSREGPGRSLTKHDADVAGLFRFEPTGLSVLRPFERGKIPVIFIHGLWANPWSWYRMIESLEADPAIRDRCQFWTFGYSTGDPIPYSASLLRRDLDEARRKFDPDGSDREFDRMVIVGHSMGGLLTKMMVQESGTRLWQVISDRPVDELAGDPVDRDLFRRALIFKPRPEVRRVVFINTPHRGSRLDRGGLEHIGSRLVRLPDPLRASYNRLMARNGPEFFKPHFRKGLPTSVDELEWQSPLLMGLDAVRLAPTIEAHSIIADRRDPPRAGGTDGLVAYESAHLDGTVSEFLVSSGHLCQDNPAVIREIRRILVEHGVRRSSPGRTD